MGIKDRGQRTEVGGRKSEDRRQMTDDSEKSLEVGGALRFRLEAMYMVKAVGWMLEAIR